MGKVRSILVLAALLAVEPGVAAGGPVLTFEGLKNFEAIENYYNGGKGSLGTGPGPKYGITFSSNALAYIPGEQSGKVTPYPGDPSPPTVMLLGALGQGLAPGQPISATMDVSGGFTGGLLFYDIAIVKKATVTIWSGLDGTGKQLAQMNLPLVPAGNEAFGPPIAMMFSGTAKSVVFSGGNDELAFDDITFGVPEPASWLLLACGITGVAFWRKFWCGDGFAPPGR